MCTNVLKGVEMFESECLKYADKSQFDPSLSVCLCLHDILCVKKR